MPEFNVITAPGPGSGRPDSNGVLTIKQINIGQGNLTYIICPNGKRVLIDAGSDDMGGITLSDVAVNLNYAQPFQWSTTASGNPRQWYQQTNLLYVDLIILTHSDSDHYNKVESLVSPLSPVQQVYIGGPISGYNSSTKFRKWSQLYDNIATRTNPETGKDEKRIDQIIIDSENRDPLLLCDGGIEGGQPCEIWAIAGSVPGENPVNANSVVVKIIYGNVSAMITGDATVDTENFILGNAERGNYPFPLTTNWLLVPHHGSETSSSPSFIQAVSPQIAVISAKDGNGHGLPRKNIVKQYTDPADMLNSPVDNHRLATYTLQDVESDTRTTKSIWQTGVSGTLSYVLDGTSVMNA